MFQSLPAALLVLVASVVVLIMGSTFFLNSASKIAKHFGISEFIIGLTVVSLGTSLPELATSISASLAGNPSVILGNILGSNIANIGLVLGLTLMFSRIVVKSYEFEKIFILLISVLLFSLFASDLIISRFETVLLLGTFFLYTLSIVKFNFKFQRPKTYKDFFRSFFKLRGLINLKKLNESRLASKKVKGKIIRGPSKKLVKEAFAFQLIRDFALLILGIILLVLGAKFTVDSAVDIAFFLAVPEAVVAALLIAIGTSLPELFVNLTGVIRGYTKIVLGNILGSNIFNTAVVLGIAGMIRPIVVSQPILNFLVPAMLIFTFFLFFLLKRSKVLGRAEGVILTVLYLAFLVLLFSVK